MPWITPGGRAMRRRVHWFNFEEALMFFHSKPLFKNSMEECLWDYVTYAMKPTGQWLSLRFDPYVEA